MIDWTINILANGLLGFSVWGYIAVALVFTHLTIASVTIYLHRHQAHRALDLHPIPSHFFRFWLWLTTGMVTKAWSAIGKFVRADLGEYVFLYGFVGLWLGAASHTLTDMAGSFIKHGRVMEPF